MKNLLSFIILYLFIINQIFTQDYCPHFYDSTSTQFEKFYFNLSNPETQLQKTIFPVLYITIYDSSLKIDTLILDAQKWNNINISDPYFIGYFGLYSFKDIKCKVEESNEMLVTIQSKGIIKEYYFGKIANEWRLLRIINKIRTNLFSSKSNSKHECFEDFIQKFISDVSFRKNRIIYPLETITFPGLEKFDTAYLPFEQINPFLFEDWHNIITFYNNYKKKISETNFRYLSSYGYQNGIKYGYIFRCKKKTWFLLATWDMSN
jgi:hypothetical protein